MFAQVIVESQQYLEPGITEKYVVPILPYFDILYCLLTLGLLIVAWKGLKQIALGREIANLNAHRDALKVAAEQCKLYAETIIPASTHLSLNPKLLQIIDSFSVSVKNSTISLTPNKGIKVESDINSIRFDSDFISLLNAIESFSQYFTSGLADEENAYKCLGYAHLSIVSPFIPLLVLRDQVRHEHKWRNTLTLFITWHERQHMEKIEYQKQELSKTTQLLEEEEALHKSEPIHVLNVDTFYNWSPEKKH